MASDSKDREASMRSIITEQFGAELAYKESELTQIEDRIRLAKLMLQRLRMGVLAQHYGSAGFYPTELDYSQENIGTQGSWDSFEQAALRGADDKEEPSNELSTDIKDSQPDTAPPESEGNLLSEEMDVKSSQETVVKEEAMDSEPVINGPHMDSLTSAPVRVQPICLPPVPASKSHDQSHDQTTSDQESRFYRKKRIIVGNTSQFLDPSSQCGGSTHKWMAYVRGSQSEPDISHFVKAVRYV